MVVVLWANFLLGQIFLNLIITQVCFSSIENGFFMDSFIQYTLIMVSPPPTPPSSS